MPMNEDEKRREYRSGYDPRGNQAQRTNTAAGANRWGGVWDSVRSEMNALSNSPMGRDVGRVANFAGDVVGAGIEGTSKALSRTWQGVGSGVRAYGEYTGGPTSPIANAGRRSEEYWNREAGAFDREKRLAQAGMPSQAVPAHGPRSNQPVMSESARDPKDRSRAPLMNEPPPQDGGLGAGPGGKPPLSESAAGGSTTKTGSRTGPGIFRKGIGDPMQVAESDREYMGAAPATDPRKRYMDMANMSLEQREQFLNSLPEGQRPIQTIRGNREGWYNPALSQEFGSIPEAMSGVEGRPTYLSEEVRRNESLKRQAGLDKQRYASDMAYRAQIDSQNISQAGQDRRSALTVSKGGKGGQGEEWKFERNPNAEGGELGIMVEKHSGAALPVRIGEEENLAAIFRNLTKKDDWGAAAYFLERYPRDIRNGVFKYLSDDMKEYMIGYFQGTTAKGEKKEK